MNPFNNKIIVLILGCFTLSNASAFSGNSSNPIPLIQQILQNPPEAYDLARLKFTFDKYIDPQTDVDAGVQQVDRMASTVLRMAGDSATSFQKMQALRKFIYMAGEWNGYKPFQYDHEDPYGQKISNKLMQSYIDSRRGNCITMPFLFILLGERLGLKVTASRAPLHVFVKFTDDATGYTFNVEATSGANPARDIWYQQNMPMTEKALANGVYMQPLSRPETIVVMATVLVEYYIDTGKYQEAIQLAEILLKHYPNDAYLYTKIGTAYYHLLDLNFYQRFPTPKQIPRQQLGLYQHWSEQNRLAFAKAEALGWQPAEN